MTPADPLSNPEIFFPGKLQAYRCPVCEALHLETEALIRKTEAATARAEAFKQKALALKDERERLLHLLFSSKPEET